MRENAPIAIKLWEPKYVGVALVIN